MYLCLYVSMYLRMDAYMDTWVCLKIVYPIVPNGFADHYPYEKWLAIIGNINPTFSDKPTWVVH